MNTPHRFSFPLRHALLACLAALLLAVSPPRAQAQFGLGGLGAEMGDLVKPSTSARLLKQYAEILGLSPDQKRAADELLIAYHAEFRDNVARLEEIYTSVNEEVAQTGDWTITQTAMVTVMVKFLKKAETLNNGFMNDLQTILTPDQAERFPQVERLQRRSAAIKMGLDGVQRVDLFDIVHGLRLDPAAYAAAAPVLEQYSIAMDKELVARDRMFRGLIEDMAKAAEDGKTPQEDPSAMMKWMSDIGEAGKRIGGINTSYIPQVRAALPESVQVDYDARVKLAKYPGIYKTSYAGRVFDALDKMSDIDSNQKSSLAPLKEAYFREAGAANDKWAAVLDELKAEQGADMFGGGMWQIVHNPKYVEARDARKAIDDRTVESITAILTEDQRAKLPKKNYRPEWDFDRRGAE